MVNETVDRGRCRHRIFEYLFPFREREITR